MSSWSRQMIRHIHDLSATLCEEIPDLTAPQLPASHPADDARGWIFHLSAWHGKIHTESSTRNLSFLIEWTSGKERIEGDEIRTGLAEVRDLPRRVRQN
jgi:hypothetical protein